MWISSLHLMKYLEWEGRGNNKIKFPKKLSQRVLTVRCYREFFVKLICF